MTTFFRSIALGVLLLVNAVVSLLFIICSLAPYMHPGDWWFTGFLGLSFPYLLFFLLCIIGLSLLFKRKWAILPVLALLIGSKTVLLHFPLRTAHDFNYRKATSSVRVMSWNLRHFIPFEEKYFKPDGLSHQKKVLDQVKKYAPDIICFQEFTSMPGEGLNDPMRIIKEQLGYRYSQFAGADIFGTQQYSGIAIFSKFPILNGGVIPYPASDFDNTESTVYADLLIAEDTIRVYSIHLQSFGFGAREYQTINEVNEDREIPVLASRQLLSKMRNTFYWHGVQADFISRTLAASPYNSIIAGDLNDVPGSYAYARVKDDRKDAFLEQGIGLGPTFTSSSSSLLQHIPTLRIDYIFHPASFKTLQFTRGQEKLSDHALLVADLQFGD